MGSDGIMIDDKKEMVEEKIPYKPTVINTDETKEKKINIVDLFPDAEPTSSGFKCVCPSCSWQGGRTPGFILFPDSNSAFCHSSGKWFTMLESYALKKGIIRCMDGREPGSDTNAKILGGELWTSTLSEFKNEYTTETFNKLLQQYNIRKEVILPGPGTLVSDFADEMGDLYKTRNVLFFRGESRDVVEIGKFVTINQDNEIQVERGFLPVEGDRFVSLVELFIYPKQKMRTKNGEEIEVTKSMTQTMAKLCLASPNFQDKLPIIKRIFDIQIPIMYKGKLTFPKKGYDKRFASWLPFNAPKIKKDMYNLEQAKSMINNIFSEFCFQSEKDRTHAIAAFITPFLRGLLPKLSTRTPVFIYMANRERAGKDYCAGCTGILYEGCSTEEPAISNGNDRGNNDEEIRKKIMACMIQGKKRFHSSNNKGLLNSAAFEGVTTAETWNDRVLGKSTNISFDNEMDFSLSGNLGIRFTPDLANRARIINLHLVDEDANARTFKNPNLHEYILNNRGDIISALYVLVENWVNKGMLPGSVPFTSFPYWARVCGGVMEAAGYDNPCKKDDSAIISLDTETEEMKLLFETCYEKYPNKWMTKQEIQQIIEQEGIMPSMDFNTMSDRVKYGNKIDKFVNRMLSNILMKVDSLSTRACRRKFMFVSDNLNFSAGQLGQFGELHHLVNDTLKCIIKEGVNPANPSNPAITTQQSLETNQSNLSKSESLETKPQINYTPEQLKEISVKFIKEKADAELSGKSKPKSDRELQYYEAPECANIVAACTKEQTLEWIKNNPGVSFIEMDKSIGLGCTKHVCSLLEEGIIKVNLGGWEVIG